MYIVLTFENVCPGLTFLALGKFSKESLQKRPVTLSKGTYYLLTFENVCPGLTFLALGNGAPDIFSQIAASVASPHGAEMALGKKKF